MPPAMGPSPGMTLKITGWACGCGRGWPMMGAGGAALAVACTGLAALGFETGLGRAGPGAPSMGMFMFAKLEDLLKLGRSNWLLPVPGACEAFPNGFAMVSAGAAVEPKSDKSEVCGNVAGGVGGNGDVAGVSGPELEIDGWRR